MVSSAAVAAYLGASANSAIQLGLDRSVVEISDSVLRTLTSAMPMIEGLPGITGIGYGGSLAAGTNVSPEGFGSKGSGNQIG